MRVRVMAKDRLPKVGTKAEYLGDGVCAVKDRDIDGIWLTAEDGTQATDSIFLEPEVVAALVAFVNRRAA